ncbi:MAG: hypothetical protein Q8N28_01620 [bacterium]|nr:hypothetical protein [bacterium]
MLIFDSYERKSITTTRRIERACPALSRAALTLRQREIALKRLNTNFPTLIFGRTGKLPTLK